MRRFSLASLIGLVGVLSLGFAAMHEATPTAMHLALGATLLVLFVAGLAVVVGRGPAAAWRGFAFVGWGYYFLNLLAVESSIIHATNMPTEPLIDLAVDQVHPVPPEPPKPTFGGEMMVGMSGSGDVIRVQDGTTGVATSRPPTPAERRVLADYRKSYEAYKAARRAAGEKLVYARKIARAMLTLAFALLGALVATRLGPPTVQAAPPTAAQP
jgi:hypothetical protein